MIRISFSVIALLGLVVCPIGSAAEPAALNSQQVAKPPADQAAIEQTIRDFFTAYAAKDLDAAMALWSADSPDRAERRAFLADLFQNSGPFELKSLQFDPALIQGERVRIQVRFEMADLNPGPQSKNLGKLERSFQLIKADNRFQIFRYGPDEPDDSFFERMFAARNAQDLRRIIQSESTDQARQFELLQIAFVRRADSGQRRNLLRNDPFDALPHSHFATILNGQSWTLFNKCTPATPDLLEVARQRNRAAADVATFLDNPLLIAWCDLQRILVSQAADQLPDLVLQTRQVSEEFRRLGNVEGQAASKTVLGRLLLAAGDKANANVAFQEAGQLFAEVVLIDDWDMRTLGGIWSLQRAEVRRQVDQIRVNHSTGQWDAADALWQKVVRLESEICGPWHEKLAEYQLFLVDKAFSRNEFAIALNAAHMAMQTAQKVFDESHFAFRECRNQLQLAQQLVEFNAVQRAQFVASMQQAIDANARFVERNFARSLQAWDEQIGKLKELFGEDHPCLAPSWFSRAQVCFAIGKPDDGAQNLLRFVDLCEKYGLTGKLDCLNALNQIAFAHTSRALQSMQDADLNSAIAAEQRVMAAYQKSFQGLEDAAAVNSRMRFEILERLQKHSAANRASVSQILAEYQAIVALSATNQNKAEAISRTIKKLKDCLERLAPLANDEDIAMMRVELANQYHLANQLDQGLEQLLLAQRALTQANWTVGRDFGFVHLMLARAYRLRGNIRQAIDAARIAKQTYTREGRFDSDEYLFAMKLSSELQAQLGEYPAAEQDALRFIMISKQRLLPPTHPDYYGPTIARDLDAGLIKGNPAALNYIAGINDLGTVQLSAAAYQKARDNYQTALALAEKLDNSQRQRDDIDLHIIGNLGFACDNLNDLESAEKYFRLTIDLQRQRHGRADAVATSRLARVLHAQSKYQSALDLFREAEASLAANSTMNTWAHFWAEYAACKLTLGDRKGAVESLETSLQMINRRLDDLSSFRSQEGSRLAWDDFASPFSCLCTLAASPEASTEEVKHAWDWSLRINGRSLDTMVRYHQVQRQMEDDPSVAKLVQRSKKLRNEISELAVNPRADLAATTVERRIGRLRAELNDVSGQLQRIVPQMHQEIRDVAVDSLRHKLPAETALIEFVRWAPYNWQKAYQPGSWSPERYAAFILPAGADAQPSLIDLGEADLIDDRIKDVRELIESASSDIRNSSEAAAEKEFQLRSQELYELVFAPLVTKLKSTRQVFVLSDSELQRIAFETLTDRPGHYLIEDYQFAYLSSAGDLLRSTPPVGNDIWVFAGPDYDFDRGERTEVAANPVAQRDTRPDAAGTSAEAANLDRGGKWSPLPFAAEELEIVTEALAQSNFGSIHSFSGREALEEVLKSVRAPRILHLATHGFFVKDVKRADETETGRLETSGTGAGLGIGRLVQQQNPFLRSGLVLAGANRLGKENATGPTRVEDGWVTAEEIASLDLQGTELVVLSACETGLGDVKTGEGVAGLRQAFLYAGARTLVTSLYRVPDAATRHLMHHFYTGLKQRQGKLQSLRAAQLAELTRRRAEHKAAHPYFWGSFILVGNPE